MISLDKMDPVHNPRFEEITMIDYGHHQDQTSLSTIIINIMIMIIIIIVIFVLII